MHKSQLKRRVAVLLDAIEDDYQAEILEGIRQEAGRANVELVCVAGGVIAEAPHPAHARNFLFDLFDPKSVDGLVVLSAALSNMVGSDAFSRWMERYAGFPTVALGLSLDETDSILIRGGPAMERLIRHVVQDHAKSRIALIRGPRTSQDAEERFVIYQQTLQDLGLNYDPQLVVEGDWQRESGILAVKTLLDERRIDLRRVGAIVSVNDYMALGALDELRARHIDVPGDVLVTGFDDVASARSTVPSITTARQPTREVGSLGLKRLLERISNGGEAVTLELEAQVVQRSSCGCHVDGLALSTAARSKDFGAGIHAALLARRSLLVAELARAARGSLNGVGAGWEDRLINAFLSDMTGANTSSFLSQLEKMVNRLQVQHGEVAVLHTIVDAFRGSVQPALANDPAAILRASDLFDWARRLVGDTMTRERAHRGMEELRFLRQLNRISGSFISFTPRALRRKETEARLRSVGIGTILIARFAQPGTFRTTGEVLSLLAHGVSLPTEEFPSESLAPEEWFATCREPVLIQPLTWNGVALGLVALPLTAFAPAVLEQVKETLSVGLWGACALEQPSGPGE